MSREKPLDKLIPIEWDIIHDLQKQLDTEVSHTDRVKISNSLAYHINTLHKLLAKRDEKLADEESLEEDILEHRFSADWAGYDPGGKQNPAAFVALKKEGRVARVVLIRERLGEEYGAFSAFVKFAQDRLGLQRIAVDETGLGKPIVEDLINMGLPIKPINVTKRVKLDLFKWLTVCFEQRKIVIPDHEKLLL